MFLDCCHFLNYDCVDKSKVTLFFRTLFKSMRRPRQSICTKPGRCLENDWRLCSGLSLYHPMLDIPRQYHLILTLVSRDILTSPSTVLSHHPPWQLPRLAEWFIFSSWQRCDERIQHIAETEHVVVPLKFSTSHERLTSTSSCYVFCGNLSFEASPFQLLCGTFSLNTKTWDIPQRHCSMYSPAVSRSVQYSCTTVYSTEIMTEFRMCHLGCSRPGPIASTWRDMQTNHSRHNKSRLVFFFLPLADMTSLDIRSHAAAITLGKEWDKRK